MLARSLFGHSLAAVEATWAICRRDLVAALTSPLAWLVLACWIALVNILFVYGLFEIRYHNGSADQPLFVSSLHLGAWLLILLAPALTMTSFASERAQGTLQLLLTVPVREHQIVIGKFLAVMGVLLLLILATLVQPLVLAWISSVQMPHLLAGYVGLLLSACFYAALGLWISLLVDSPAAAYVLTFGAIAVLHLVSLAGIGNSFSPVAEALGLGSRIAPFFAGELRLGGVAYLLCGSAVMLLFSVQALRSKRWGG